MNILETNSEWSYLEDIRNNLWKGKVALFVGAGFSRNAERKFENSPEFPLGDDITSAIYDKLNHLTSEIELDKQRLIKYNKTKLKAISNLGALKIAQEYEVNFGESSLFKLLSELIPNEQYHPSEIYKNLLDLP